MTRERAKELYYQNREHVLALKAAWRAANTEKVKEIKKKTRSIDANREREKAGHKKWLAANAEKVAKYVAKYRANPEIKEREKARHADWYKAHPEAGAVYQRNRKARKINAGGTHTSEDIRRLYFLQKGKCVVCRAKLEKYHVDHIMPLTLGGGNGPTNLQLLCSTCNLSKYAKHPIDFMQSRGFLL